MADSPVFDDGDIISRLDTIQAENDALNQKLAALIESHNQVGQNIAWLVANTQGVFQMLQNPQMMQQLMGSVLGGKLPGMEGTASDG